MSIISIRNDLRAMDGKPPIKRKKRKVSPDFHGKKGRSGRKTNAQIIRDYINSGIAYDIANQELKKLKKKDNRSLEELKTLVMPVVLKGMKEEKEININLPKPIDDVLEEPIKKEIKVEENALLQDPSIQKDKTDEPEDKNHTGRDLGQQDSQHHHLPDSVSTER